MGATRSCVQATQAGIPFILVLDGEDDLGDQVERAVKFLRPQPQVVRRGIEEFDAVIQQGTAVDMLIAGPTFATETGLVQLRKLRLRMPETSLILAFDRLRAASLRQTVRAGAVDILRLPVDDSAIAEAVRQTLQQRAQTRTARAAAPPGGPRHGEVIAVLSATGGSGKTFLAANLAYYLQSRAEKRICLVDLDLQFGEVSTALRLKQPSTISHLLADCREDPDSIAERLPLHLAAHETGIHVLAAPDAPSDAESIGPADITSVLAAACPQFDYVIVDTPANLTEPVLAALEMASHFVAVATLDLPSVRNLGMLLTTLRRLNIPTEQVRLVLNKVEPDVGIELRHITRYFPQGFSAVVPYGREANRALNTGTPILAYAPRSEVSRRLQEGFAAVLPIDRSLPVAVNGRAGSGRSRWRWSRSGSAPG